MSVQPRNGLAAAAVPMPDDPIFQTGPLLTTDEAATRLRLSPRTLERLRVSGEGPRYVKAGPGKRARVFYRQGDLDAWLARFSYGSTSEYGIGLVARTK